MPPKCKKPDTTMDSGGSSSGSSISALGESDHDDAEDYFYESVSKDSRGRNIYKSSFISVAVSPSEIPVAWTGLPSAERQDTWIYDFIDNDWTLPVDEQPHADLDEAGDAANPPQSSSDSEPETRKREPYRPVKKWKEKHRSTWLDELLRGEGRGDHDYRDCVCGHPQCQRGWATVRCKDCHGCELLAATCMVRDHERNPLHRIQRWDSDAACFQDTSLKALGLRFQLSRELHPNRVCPHPQRAPGKNFVVIDDYGLHDVDVYYCNCGKGQSFPVQLLRAKWLPSTGKQPRTAATFNVLRRYHLLSLESKCSMGEFYQSLVRHTNNVGEPPAGRYQEFINITREWRNLQLLKRAGRGHETDGIRTTKPGACALECPACPHPGKNLPPDWKDVPPEKKFLYALFLALDANFRMQRKDMSSETADPDLGNGLAFFGEVNAYMAHLEKNWDQPQPKSTCVAHDAVNKPDRESRGTASSGVGTVDCARHNMKRPRGVGDLQQGERYLNMDYMFFMSLEDSELQQFFRNGKRFFVFLVPKFHLPAHIESCNIKFSFLLTRYVGQTDGEAPERGWSHINPLATSTREMGPHLRREILDDHFNDWNWKKILNMGTFFLGKIKDYVPDMVKTRRDTREQERTLPRATVVEWEKMCVAWEADASKPNPFERTVEVKTIASVRYELVQEGGGIVRGQTDSAEMLAMGVQLEEQQRQLKFDQAAAGAHPTVDQKRVMLERCSKARRKILTWMDVQAQFMPEVSVLRAAAAEKRAEESRTNPVAGELVQDMPLLLPSDLPPDVTCLRELQDFEFRLREGQAHEALFQMRHQLLVRTHEYKYKDQNIRGVRDGMRSNTRIEGIDNQIQQATAMYQAARKALEVLGERLHRTGWEKVLKPLKKEDVRQMPEAAFREPGAAAGKKRRKETAAAKKRRRTEARTPASWIWMADGSAEDADRNPAMNEALRIEWAKTRALGLRNTEEVDLLEEEIRRVPVYLRWRADWWTSLKLHAGEAQRPDLQDNDRQREGHDAYATRQALLLRRIAQRFEEKWAIVPQLIALGRAEVTAMEAEAAELAAAEEAAEQQASAGAESDGDEEREDGDEDDEGDDGDEDDEGDDEGHDGDDEGYDGDDREGV
ncbi:hypothetical protein B0H11DRAFT_2237257 [Mycena galericulata]|nr:hypothetical protein B0H11DRAFT_2237257 [Mycena galericulata]